MAPTRVARSRAAASADPERSWRALRLRPSSSRRRAPRRGTPPPAFRGRSARERVRRLVVHDAPSRRMMTRSHSRSTSAMLWEASRIVAPRRRRKSSRWPRTQSAVSGSSEAVGSSSSRRSGSLTSALASATRVFWPAESWPTRRSRSCVEVEGLASSLDRATSTRRRHRACRTPKDSDARSSAAANPRRGFRN